MCTSGEPSNFNLQRYRLLPQLKRDFYRGLAMKRNLVVLGGFLLAVSVATPHGAQAQGNRSNCGAYGGGGVLPPECMTARPTGSASTSTTMDIEAIEKASYAKPVAATFPRNTAPFI